MSTKLAVVHGSAGTPTAEVIHELQQIELFCHEIPHDLVRHPDPPISKKLWANVANEIGQQIFASTALVEV